MVVGDGNGRVGVGMGKSQEVPIAIKKGCLLYTSVQRGSMKGKAKGGTRLNHGEYGIQALEAAWITNRQICLLYTSRCV